jgi:hypothetical protein
LIYSFVLALIIYMLHGSSQALDSFVSHIPGFKGCPPR